MVWIIPPIVMVAWLVGGQINKGVRRFGMPLTTTALGAISLLKRKDKQWWVALFILLYIPILSIGYGVDSVLGKWLGGREWLIRLLYALVCCVPLLMIQIFVQDWWKLAIMLPMIVGSFQVRAGGVKVGNYDLLWEDVIRSLVLGSCVAWSLV